MEGGHFGGFVDEEVGGHVGVDFGHADVAVAEHGLEAAEVDSGLDGGGGSGVSEQVVVDGFGDPGAQRCGFDPFFDVGLGGVGAGADEEIFVILFVALFVVFVGLFSALDFGVVDAGFFYALFELVADDGDDAGFVAFTSDVEESAFEVDVAAFQVEGFVAAESAEGVEHGDGFFVAVEFGE